MYSYTATIGRNIGGMPMSDLDWETFIDDVSQRMGDVPFPAQVYCLEVHRGTGAWEGESEDSAKITLITRSALPENDDSCRDLLAIRSGLHILAQVYNQDAIALTIGTSELISSSTLTR